MTLNHNISQHLPKNASRCASRCASTCFSGRREERRSEARLSTLTLHEGLAAAARRLAQRQRVCEREAVRRLGKRRGVRNYFPGHNVIRVEIIWKMSVWITDAKTFKTNWQKKHKTSIIIILYHTIITLLSNMTGLSGLFFCCRPNRRVPSSEPAMFESSWQRCHCHQDYSDRRFTQRL